jgi:Flp pilus assembly protein TadD
MQANLVVGLVNLSSGNHERAMDVALRVREVDPDFPGTYWLSGAVYLRRGDYDMAIADFRRNVELQGMGAQATAALGLGYAEAGMPDKAREVLKELESTAEQEYIAPSRIGVIYAALGEANDAFEWLDKAYDERDANLLFIGIEHAYDKIRSDPRFIELLEKIGLAE